MKIKDLKKYINGDFEKISKKIGVILVETGFLNYSKLNSENDIVKKRESWNKIIHVLTEIAWHISNNLWEHTREYYEGDGSEKLKELSANVPN